MLYLVATPIGDVGDISFRAIEILKNVDLIACEDTRAIRFVLNHYEIKKKLVSFHTHNEEKSGQKIISFLKEGNSVALVSDRGNPVICDPGFTLVNKAIEENIEFTMVSGPSAFLIALIISGLPAHSFVFRGFPPYKSGKRQNFLKQDKLIPYTLIYYESPHRIMKFLNDALLIFGDRRACVANDLTKKYEKITRGKLSEIIGKLENTKILGEFTVVIEGHNDKNE